MQLIPHLPFKAVNVKQIAQHISQVLHKCHARARDDQDLGKIQIAGWCWNLKILQRMHSWIFEISQTQQFG